MSVHLKTEHDILKNHTYVAGVDEVGRGAFAGPVVVGICVVSKETKLPPDGLNDSKLGGGSLFMESKINSDLLPVSESPLK
jgi:ribonuclease HIII